MKAIYSGNDANGVRLVFNALFMKINGIQK